MSDNKLISAAGFGDLADVRRHVGNFNINALGSGSTGTALLEAAARGHTEVVKLLLTFNPDVNLSNNYDRMSPLNAAASNGHIEVVRVLLKVRGINVNSACSQGLTALVWAAYRGHTEVVNELLKVHDINVNHVCNNGSCNALIYAAMYGHTEMVQALLKHHNININHADSRGRKAIDHASKEEIRNLLRNWVPTPRPVVPSPRPVVPSPSRVLPFRPYVGPAIMSFRDTSRSVLASGRSVAAHTTAATTEERAAQELSLILDALCKSGEFRDLSAVTRVLAKPTGQSVVFEGVYKGQAVAVKVFRDKTTKDTAANEVAYLRRCAHRHVLGELNTYEYNGRSLLVMPLARGDLQAVIERAEGPLPHAQVTEYVKQVATALSFLHDEKRVAHLDLKAGNVFIANDGRAMLADFGMAMDIKDITRDELLACGTPMFQAPELWAQRLSEPVQRGNRAKVDVYAFGCMVWQLLTRQLPFQREIENNGWVDNDFLLLATAVRRERRSPGEAGMMESRWPEPLRRLIQACCAYEPERRPTMAQLLAEHLR